MKKQKLLLIFAINLISLILINISYSITLEEYLAKYNISTMNYSNINNSFLTLDQIATQNPENLSKVDLLVENFSFDYNNKKITFNIINKGQIDSGPFFVAIFEDNYTKLQEFRVDFLEKNNSKFKEFNVTDLTTKILIILDYYNYYDEINEDNNYFYYDFFKENKEQNRPKKIENKKQVSSSGGGSSKSNSFNLKDKKKNENLNIKNNHNVNKLKSQKTLESRNKTLVVSYENKIKNYKNLTKNETKNQNKISQKKKISNISEDSFKEKRKIKFNYLKEALISIGIFGTLLVTIFLIS